MLLASTCTGSQNPYKAEYDLIHTDNHVDVTYGPSDAIIIDLNLLNDFSDEFGYESFDQFGNS